jgi:AcrR family transcriptional regulator
MTVNDKKGDKGHPSEAEPPVRRTQAQRTAATREALLSAARALFAEHGFAGTPREDIVERAGVTRGALHHHFGRKEDLFLAVFEQLEDELTKTIAMSAMTGKDSMEQLGLGAQAFLDAALEPAFQRIVLVDAPAVFGWEKWRDLDARHGLGLVTEGLRMAMNDGFIEERSPELLAHIVLASLNEAALLVAGSDDPMRTRAEVGETINHLLSRL